MFWEQRIINNVNEAWSNAACLMWDRHGALKSHEFDTPPYRRRRCLAGWHSFCKNSLFVLTPITRIIARYQLVFPIQFLTLSFSVLLCSWTLCSQDKQCPSDRWKIFCLMWDRYGALTSPGRATILFVKSPCSYPLCRYFSMRNWSQQFGEETIKYPDLAPCTMEMECSRSGLRQPRNHQCKSFVRLLKSRHCHTIPLLSGPSIPRGPKKEPTNTTAFPRAQDHVIITDPNPLKSGRKRGAKPLWWGGRQQIQSGSKPYAPRRPYREHEAEYLTWRCLAMVFVFVADNDTGVFWTLC